MRTAATLFLSVCSTLVLAALPPNAPTTLADHLREVNGQWTVQDPQAIDAQHTASFGVDADRIALHLHLVSDRLTARTPQGISSSQRNARLHLLHRLHGYADAGTFPKNHVLPYRNPVFIDPHGTACAVGWLMIESGHRELAERISAEMNLAYVLDMPSTRLWPEVAAWADAHGFTAGELAWIQPGYPPNYDWFPLGGGTNGTVTVLKKLANGDLLVAGDFTEAGGSPMNRVAIWDGSNYTALGSGLDGLVTCAVEFNGDLYVGGAEFAGFTDLAKWNGSSWSFSTVFQGKYPYISALHVHDGLLHAAGAMSGFAGSTDFVQVFDGAQWIPVGSPFNGPVRSLATHNSALVAGGAFTGIQSPNLPPPVMYVAQMGDVDWTQLGDGLDAPVRTLLDVNGTLYAGGELYANIAVAFGLARMGSGATAWEHLLPNHPSYITAAAGPSWIGSITTFNDEIYFGGQFYISQVVGTYGNNLARFYGTPDAITAMVIVDAPVNALAVADEQLIAGGAFEVAFPHAITLDLTTIVVDPAERISFTLAPNPATDILRLTVGDMSLVNMTVTITDVSGRVVATLAKGSAPSMAIDVRHLPAGSYQLRTEVDGAVSAQRFVKQ